MTRASDYGKAWAITINRFISKIIPENERVGYRKRFLDEFQNYSLKPKKKNSLTNPEDHSELADIIENFDPENPEHYARLCKEGLHLMYQKGTAARTMKSFLENL